MKNNDTDFRLPSSAFKTLLLKDIKLLLRDLKFQIFMVILMILFVLSAISSSATYDNYRKEYQDALTTHQNKKANGKDFQLIEMISGAVDITVIDMPTPSLLFSRYENFPNIIRNQVDFYSPRFQRYKGEQEAMFSLDWYFILAMLAGFIMLILSFEAISREKRAGTFRLLSISGFKRQSILWHKYISYMILYLLITFVPALLSLLLFFALTATWDGVYMVKFLIILLLSIPFASFFVFLGMFISMFKNYRNSIIFVVFSWLLFVIIVPQSANIFGRIITPLMSTAEESARIKTARDNATEAAIEKYGDRALSQYYIDDGVRVKWVIEQDEAQALEWQRQDATYKKQTKTILNIDSISPFAQFSRISEIVFDKGYYLFEAMQQTTKNTISQLRNLMIEQDSRDETSAHYFYSWARNDNNGLLSGGRVPFSMQMFDQPDFVFVTNIPTDDMATKALKILFRLLPILVLNLVLIVCSVVKLEKLDIR